ncbi:periplasmic divalent cation tolerance protein [Strigomonas culicis]|uniref:Periplasmic divalent cation tolerance protein n=1 Tax=Strigomonas culicis TaxID=28005 RepID=S9UKZ5_9TRYP|nr:periplasmic divalent cation tolerance protein [Strigomonas culicis]|eukprot:EPY31517.1 periplasmic divalent cation tolerance protein [Strigomonas culicis]
MFSMCYMTAPSLEVGKRIARLLVTQRRAACVNLLPAVTSIYSWEGQLEESEEVLMLIKTQTACVSDVITAVREHHPYDCPEVVSVVLGEGSDPYLAWVAAQTDKRPPLPSTSAEHTSN